MQKGLYLSYWYRCFLFCIIGSLFCVAPIQATPQTDEGPYTVMYVGEEKAYTVAHLSDIDAHKTVQSVEKSVQYHDALIPNDQYFNKQWYLMQINVPDVWDRVQEKDEVVVAVLDTGVDIRHPELDKKIWTNTKEIPGDGIDNDQNGYVDDVHGWDFVDNVADPSPKTMQESFNKEGMVHGTIIAGIIAAKTQNKEGIAGMTSKAKIMPLRVLNGLGHGDTATVVNAILYAQRQGAKIINLSFVGPDYSRLLKEIIKDAYQKGVLVVAAAGNNTVKGGVNLDEDPMYPICYDTEESQQYILGVGATNQQDERSSFSNYGKCVDISAPGEQFYGIQYVTAALTGFSQLTGGNWAGTSLSAPLVSATAALLKSAYPYLSNDDVVRLLLDNTDSIAGKEKNKMFEGKLGTGRLNTFKTFLAAKSVIPGEKKEVAAIQRDVRFIVAPQSNSISEVKLLDAAGNAVNNIYAYDSNFRNGVNVTMGDIDGDGVDEIVTAPKAGGGPHIRIFNKKGGLVAHFMAFDPKSRFGATVTTCDVNGDGKSEVIVGAGIGMEPKVRIFTQTNQDVFSFTEFNAYDATFKGGVNVSCGDVDLDGKPEIITGVSSNGAPHVRMFTPDGVLVSHFMAFDQKMLQGVNVMACDVDGDKQDEVVVSQASGGKSSVRVFRRKSNVLYQFKEFLAYDKNFTGGVNLGCGLGMDGSQFILTGAGTKGGPHVKVFDGEGKMQNEWFVYDKKFFGGVNVAASKRH